MGAIKHKRVLAITAVSLTCFGYVFISDTLPKHFALVLR